MNTEKTVLEKRDKIVSLQTVRALAFLGIFSSHCEATHLGAWGVSVFLILSGFVMVYTYHDRLLESSLKSCIIFSLEKVKKLYGLHILMMLTALVFVIKALVSNFAIKQFIFMCMEVFFNVTLLQTWIPSSTIYYSLNGVSWYLSVCLFLYAVFPLLLKQIKKLSSKKSFLFIISIYMIQIVIGVVTQFIDIPIVYSDNFSKWVIYIFPLFRLGDFAIGCCLGNIYLHEKFVLNEVIASVLEILVFIAIFGAGYFYVNQIGFLGSEWFRHTMLYTPTSICIVLLFALKQGIISKCLTCKVLVFVGDLSAYMFLIHQMVIQYIDVISIKLVGNALNIYVKVIMAFIITVLCANGYKKLSIRKKDESNIKVEKLKK